MKNRTNDEACQNESEYKLQFRKQLKDFLIDFLQNSDHLKQEEMNEMKTQLKNIQELTPAGIQYLKPKPTKLTMP